MLEFIRFALFALCVLAAVAAEILSVFGVNRFKYAANRLHTASIGDTLGVFFAALACIIYTGFNFLALKLVFVVVLMWLTCPISGHLISQLLYRTDPDLEKEADKWQR